MNVTYSCLLVKLIILYCIVWVKCLILWVQVIQADQVIHPNLVAQECQVHQGNQQYQENLENINNNVRHMDKIVPHYIRKKST